MAIPTSFAPKLPFTLTDPEGLAFDEDPTAFVNVDADPIILSVRGIAYFKPRFKYVGIDLRTVRTGVEFRAAYERWMETERALLGDMIKAKSLAELVPAEHSLLQAIWTGDIVEAEAISERLSRRARSNLRAVPRPE